MQVAALNRKRSVLHQARLPAMSAALRGLLVTSLLAIAPGLALAAGSCTAISGATVPRVVELYTSEGCSSCPPADRWLSSLKDSNGGADALLALAFHVTYWDRLGWADRFASPAYTERQNLVVSAQGGRVVYTPQVIVNGADWRSWPRLPKPATSPPVDLQLSRDGSTLTAQITQRKGAVAAPQQLSGYWVVLEDGHRTEVRAGENAGESLRHDHVVRAYQPVGVWPADREQRWQWQAPTVASGDAASARRIAFVVVDSKTQKPLQALALSC